MHAFHRGGARRPPATTRRVSYSAVTATLALVLAIGGGTALAAHNHYLIFSIHQIKPKVVRQLRDHRGPRGYRGYRGYRGSAGPSGATGATGAAGAVAGFSVVNATAVPFTGTTNTQVIAKALPTGAFVLTGSATIAASSTAATTAFDVTCSVSDSGSTSVYTAEFAGVTNGAGNISRFTLPLTLAVTTTTGSTAKIACTDVSNGGNGYSVSATSASLTAVQTTSNS